MEPRWTEEDVYHVSQRAWELAMQGRHAEAGVILEGLASIAPANPWLGRALAVVHIRMGRPEAAAALAGWIPRRPGAEPAL